MGLGEGVYWKGTGLGAARRGDGLGACRERDVGQMNRWCVCVAAGLGGWGGEPLGTDGMLGGWEKGCLGWIEGHLITAAGQCGLFLKKDVCVCVGWWLLAFPSSFAQQPPLLPAGL